MQPYKPSAPSRTENMIAVLRARTNDKLSRDAADEIERLRTLEFRLARRIHEQRVNLRMNWGVMAQHAAYRRGWRQSPLLTQILRSRRRKDFLERWYGDECPPWTWPTTFMVASLLFVLATLALPRL